MNPILFEILGITVLLGLEIIILWAFNRWDDRKDDS